MSELGGTVSSKITFDTRWQPADSVSAHTSTVLAPVGFVEFGFCPICLDEIALTAEHVPPKGVGGRRLTRTCADCNSELGARVDRDFIHQVRYSGVRRVWLSMPGVEGARREPFPPVPGRASDGRPAFMFMRQPSPEIGASLKAGVSQLAMTVEEVEVWRIGLLKSAYLAFCCAIHHVPRSDGYGQIRAELISARDGRISTDAESGEAMSLEHFRTPTGFRGAHVAEIECDDGWRPAILLGSTLVVSEWIDELRSVNCWQFQ